MLVSCISHRQKSLMVAVLLTIIFFSATVVEASRYVTGPKWTFNNPCVFCACMDDKKNSCLVYEMTNCFCDDGYYRLGIGGPCIWSYQCLPTDQTAAANLTSNVSMSTAAIEE
ncbi:uncharacterized protein LOC144100291 [Amblyomma americanum]